LLPAAPFCEGVLHSSEETGDEHDRGPNH
jgi:hypothetical protein